MKKTIRKTTLTLEGEFRKGLESGEFPHPESNRQAIYAITRKSTEPLVRAYWSGYLCKLTPDQMGFKTF